MSMADHPDPLQIAPDPATLHAFHRQQLSAMLDGELSPDEARFMLRRLEHDVNLARCWERWQLCGEVLRGRADGLLPADFAARVTAAVQAPAPRPQAKINTPRRTRGLAWSGMGLAASLALTTALMVMWPSDGEDMPAEPQVATTSVLTTTEPTAMARDSGLAQTEVSGTQASAVVVAPAPSQHAAHELLAPIPTLPVPALPRPWPRAGGGAGAFSVGYGPPPIPADPFQPRWTPPPSAFWPEAQMPGDNAHRTLSRQD